jgi:hypothetical protein
MATLSFASHMASGSRVTYNTPSPYWRLWDNFQYGIVVAEVIKSLWTPAAE